MGRGGRPMTKLRGKTSVFATPTFRNPAAFGRLASEFGSEWLSGCLVHCLGRALGPAPQSLLQDLRGAGFCASILHFCFVIRV